METKLDEIIYIYPWMTEYNITSSEVLVYALIYQYTHETGKKELECSQEYIAERVGITPRNVIKVIHKLIDKGFIVREVNNNKESPYWYTYRTVN